MAQEIRRSQFVLTYGPGAILEGANGPRLIPSPGSNHLFGRTFNNRTLIPSDFEISFQRMSGGILDRAKIFRLPSNAEVGIDGNRYMYFTKEFPSWSLCVSHGILYRSYQTCPRCDQGGGQGRREAIRFVRACTGGHLDDVDWDFVVHRGGTCNGTDWYLWMGGGASLQDVMIRCPECGREENLGRAYGQDWVCSGRFPEREGVNSPPHRPGGCDRPSRIIQRQASNLHMAEIATMFTIPPRYTALHRLLESTPIFTVLILPIRPTDMGSLSAILTTLVQQGMIPASTQSEISRHSWQEIEGAIRDITQPVPQGIRPLLIEEFDALMRASILGAPPVATPPPASRILFQVIPSSARRFQGPNGNVLRVVPVSKLNTVIVQRGYRRLDPNPMESSTVDISFIADDGHRWLPGVEFLGEGIFIMLDNDDGWHFNMNGTASDQWRRAFEGRAGMYEASIFRMLDGLESHPVFTWWHTLSHLLIRELAVDSGYSSSSIRERVYLELDDEAGRARGGVILYTVQPGADGTLGGLVSLVPNFQSVLSRVWQLAEDCSNDPLCLENTFSPGHFAGAACYGCLFASETSCEHSNMWLDRKLFLDNLP